MRDIESFKVAKVSSNDSALLVYIPKTVCSELGLRRGSYVMLKVENGKLIIEPLNIETSEKEQRNDAASLSPLRR